MLISKMINKRRNFEVSKEVVAKLFYLLKSMILRPVREWQRCCYSSFDEANPNGLVEENGREMAQKGDFSRQMSFATASKK